MSGEIKLEEIDTQAFTDRYGKLAINVTPAKAAAGQGRQSHLAFWAT